MEPIHLQNPVVTLTLLVCTFLYPSETTMPNFRGPTTSGRRTIDEVNDSLRKRIQRDMPWAQIHTRNGKTQESESKYIDHSHRGHPERGRDDRIFRRLTTLQRHPRC
jgi:hypothetical protein